jgi:hypothetical protein
MATKRNIAECVATAVSVMAGCVVPAISVDRMAAVSTALAAFAGVVVTVFGIWVAIIFPKMLAGLESGVKSEGVPERARYRALIESLYRSCFVLCAASLVFLLVSFFGNDSRLFVASFSTFCWLSFSSISSALWVAVMSGEGAVVKGINDGIAAGVRRRVRGMGKVQKKG